MPFEAYAQTPRPFTPAEPVRYGLVWYSTFTDARGVMYMHGSVPWSNENVARRAGRLLCATVGANPNIILHYNRNGMGLGD